MAYGWLATKFPGTQEDGFFIDEDNQIIYWPTKAGPGYIIGPSAAHNIIEAKEKARDSILIVLPFFVWIFFPEITHYLLSMFGLTDAEHIEASGYSTLAFFFGHMGLYAVPMGIWSEWRARCAGVEHLRLSKTHLAPRPPVRYVSPVNWQSVRNIVLHIFAVILVLFLGPIPLFSSFYFASEIWEIVSFIPLAAFFSYYGFLHIRRIILATPSQDVRLYDIG